jgi:hypothetical protein
MITLGRAHYFDNGFELLIMDLISYMHMHYVVALNDEWKKSWSYLDLLQLLIKFEFNPLFYLILCFEAIIDWQIIILNI